MQIINLSSSEQKLTLPAEGMTGRLSTDISAMSPLAIWAHFVRSYGGGALCWSLDPATDNIKDTHKLDNAAIDCSTLLTRSSTME